MKRKFSKILGVGLTLALLTSLLLTAVPVAAQGVIGGPFFTTANLGTAEWSTEQKVTGDYSAKLWLPAYDPARQYDEARIVFNYDGDLNSITGLSYPSYVIGGNDGVLHACVVLAVDTTGDTAVDSWVCQFDPFGSHPPSQNAWETITFDNSSTIHVAGLRTGLPEGQYLSQTTETSATDTLGSLKAESGWAAFEVLEVKVYIGEFTGGFQGMTAYVDDVTINGVTYALEPSGDLEVDAEVGGVTGVDPATGVIDTTPTVVITGYGFTGASAVSFGADITTDSYLVDSNTQITAQLIIDAAAAAGPRDVTVTITEGNIIGRDLFAVEESFTVMAPSGISLGMMLAGTTTFGQSIDANDGTVVTNRVDPWTVLASDLSTGGYMTSVAGTLTNAFQISEGGVTYSDAAPGITYADSPVSLPFFVSQEVVTGDEVGAYTITITFTGTY